MPLKPGDSTFNKVLKEYGGYVLDNKWIKYIFSIEIHAGINFVVQAGECVMHFGIINSELRSRLTLYLYEPVTDKHFIAKTLKFTQFNGKVYKLSYREIIGTVLDNGIKYYKYLIRMDEV